VITENTFNKCRWPQTTISLVLSDSMRVPLADVAETSRLCFIVFIFQDRNRKYNWYILFILSYPIVQFTMHILLVPYFHHQWEQFWFNCPAITLLFPQFPPAIYHGVGRALSFPADSRQRTVLSANMPQLLPPRKIIVTFVTAKIRIGRWKRDSTPAWHYHNQCTFFRCHTLRQVNLLSDRPS